MRTMIVLLALVLGVTPVAGASSEPVRDRYGRTIAYVRADPSGRVTVMDCYGTTLGSATGAGTFDRFGAKILQTPVPGVLVSSSRCATQSDGGSLLR